MNSSISKQEEAPKLEMILERIGPGSTPDNFKLWACRGARKGCPKKIRKQKHCPDCVETDEKETIGEVYDRVMRGNA